VPQRNAVPDTAFSAVTGFELGLADTTEHTASGAWAELQRLVTNHDRNGVEWLLVSAGAPNRNGQTFLSEELLARFLFQHPESLSTPTHIKRVTVHIWSTGEAFEVLPSPVQVFGPLCLGIVPAHRPIHPESSVSN